MTEATSAADVTPSPFAGGDWFDPLEEAVRLQVRGFIEELLEEELGGSPRPRPVVQPEVTGNAGREVQGLVRLDQAVTMHSRQRTAQRLMELEVGELTSRGELGLPEEPPNGQLVRRNGYCNRLWGLGPATTRH